MAGAPKGNNNAGKNKPFANALRRALARYEKGDVKRGNALKQIATMLVGKALEGDLVAAREIFDRVDGKAMQQVEVQATNYHFEVSSEPLSEEEWLAQANDMVPADGTAKISH